MWSLKKTEDFEDWFCELDDNDKRMARSLAQLLLLETLENEMGDAYKNESKAIIQKVMKK